MGEKEKVSLEGLVNRSSKHFSCGLQGEKSSRFYAVESFILLLRRGCRHCCPCSRYEGFAIHNTLRFVCACKWWR